MPILKDSARVYYPQTNYAIVKYLDLTKYLSLLNSRSLFFCRLDKLEDQFEGTTAKANFAYRLKWLQDLRDIDAFKKPMTNDDLDVEVKSMFDTEKKSKSNNCVCCWNKKDEESAALWKIYSDFSKGIMIKSSISRLENSFSFSKEVVRLSEIKYLNYDKERMPDGNSMYSIIHKQKAYSYEDEVRLIYRMNPFGLEHDWSKENIQEGIYIKIDIDELIEEIVIGPYSPNWYLELVNDISIKFGINKPIKKSVLSFNE